MTDDDGIPLWSEMQRLGGVAALGYPISNRFVWDNFTIQAFQKAILQWQPGRGMFFVNVFDRLSAAGLDAWLEAARATPPSFDNAADRKLSWDQILQRHLALLDVNAAIKARYLGDPAALEHYGLPMSYKDYGNVFVVRAQRAVFQQWMTDTPWARAGEVVIANGGDIAKEANEIPREAATPRVAPLPESGQGSGAVKIFLISEGTGKIGCGDSVEAATRAVPPDQATLTGAIEELLALKARQYGQTGLTTALYQANLEIQEARITNGRATVRLVGSIPPSDPCDNARIQAQLKETVRQFPNVRDVAIFINSTPLEQAALFPPLR